MGKREESDDRLAERLSRGDEAALREIINRYALRRIRQDLPLEEDALRADYDAETDIVRDICAWDYVTIDLDNVVSIRIGGETFPVD